MEKLQEQGHHSLQIIQTQNKISKLSTLSGCDYPGYSFLLKVFLCMDCFGICPVLVQGLAPTHRYRPRNSLRTLGLVRQWQRNTVKNSTHICFQVLSTAVNEVTCAGKGQVLTQSTTIQVQTAGKWFKCLDSQEQVLTFFFPVIFHSFRTWVALPRERKNKTFQQKFGCEKEPVWSWSVSNLLAEQHFYLLRIHLCGENKMDTAAYLLLSYLFWLHYSQWMVYLALLGFYGLHCTKWLCAMKSITKHKTQKNQNSNLLPEKESISAPLRQHWVH